MFIRLTLKNFKAWRETGDVELAPVTVLLGTNSSGKSSLLQSLLLLKQTAASPDRSIHLNLGGDEVNDYFNFGHFVDVLTQGASPRQFEIAFSFRRPQPSRAAGRESRPAIVGGEFRGIYGMTSSGAAAIQDLTLSGDSKIYRVQRRERGAYALFVNDESQTHRKSRTYAPERSIALPAEAIQLLELDGRQAEDISLAIRRELEGIAYLGPLRRKPERDYVWNKTRPGEIGVDGSNVINVLLASALLRSKDGEAEEIIGGVSKWLKRMGIAERLEVRQLGHSRYAIVVQRAGVAANLRDVGIGVSQVLPVLTLAYFAAAGSTVLLEEPEIHLHPSAQSVLAELFVDISRSRGVQFIVETHSEHLFRRLQTMVARGKAKTADCRLYFVERNESDAKLRRLDLDIYGRVQNWPDEFFGDAMGETGEQARLMFERQKQERQA